MIKTNKTKVGQKRTSVEAGAVVKFGLDVHADQIVARRQIEGQVAQPAQSLSWVKTVQWLKKHREEGYKVYSCYEAGPCGYGLHRQLEKEGITNFVIAPQKWDRSGKNVKTDARDATQMGLGLDQYVRGHKEAFSVVMVPSEAQEQRRSLCRHRDRLVRERQRCTVRGLGLMLAQGVRSEGEWWQPKQWAELEPTLPAWLMRQLKDWQSAALLLHRQIEELTPQIAALSEGQNLIKGYGALTAAMVNAEIIDWHRFKNRRQVGSFTGLCPSEHTTGKSRRQGSINKHGNPRVRRLLVEAIWRLLYWQQHYKPLFAIRCAKGSRARKRAVVAAARHLAIDLWRINTGQCTAQSLGLVVAE
jgi:transposase